MAKNHPEKKISPVNSGLSVAIWLNTVTTDDGPRRFRTITVAPKRYRDRNTGEWKDSGSYTPSDLPALVFALQKAIEFCYSSPLPGQKDEPGAEAPAKQPEDEVPY
ncbi:MAG: hypothetical protein HZA46_02190 [Planctomycetales bacterium]|nr:hypothetical protein [Planctomycetales bacterium]